VSFGAQKGEGGVRTFGALAWAPLVAALVAVVGCGGSDAPPRVDAGPRDAAACVADPAPPGAATCPAACTECLAGNVCRIDCTAGACNDRTVSCPPDYACDIVCHGLDACDTSIIQCPSRYACSVSCSSYDACGDVSLRCGSGACTLACTGAGASDSCGGASVTCGAGLCRVTCEGQSPATDCAAACGCVAC